MKKVEVPIFGFPLYLSNDADEVIAFAKRKAGDSKTVKDIEEAIEDALGVSVTFNGNDDRFYRIMAVFNGDIGTASHEAVHIGWSILRGASVEIDEDNHEMLAYLTDWLLTEFMRNFKLETRCKKQNGSKRGEAESVAQTAPQS